MCADVFHGVYGVMSKRGEQENGDDHKKRLALALWCWRANK